MLWHCCPEQPACDSSASQRSAGFLPQDSYALLLQRAVGHCSHRQQRAGPLQSGVPVFDPV